MVLEPWPTSVATPVTSGTIFGHDAVSGNFLLPSQFQQVPKLRYLKSINNRGGRILMKNTRYLGLSLLIAGALIGTPISAQEKGGMKDNKGMMKGEKDMMKDEKGMMKDEKDAMTKDKMKAEKKGQVGKTDDKMKMNEKKQ
jgi:hypothetical protein